MQKLFQIAIEKEKEKTFEKFDKKLTTKLSAAATAKSWSDLLPIMKDMHSFLQLNKDYDFNMITDKLLLGKRLAQGLNPECPSGLHEVTLDVYDILLNNIITKYKDKLMDNLYIYAYGLFPFFPNATLPNKRKFLERIVKSIFTKLNSVELKLCLPGLLSSLIPGLDDNNEETTKLIYGSFDTLIKMDEGRQERNFFGVYWMLLLRCKHLRASGIKYLLEKVSKYSDIKSIEDENKQKEIVDKQFPNLNITVVNALCEIIKDSEVPNVRNGMDFILTRLPLTKENTMLNDEAKINLINSALYLFIKNEYSTIRRLKSWLLGIDNVDDEVDFNSEDIKYKMGLVIEAIKLLFKQDNVITEEIIKNNLIILERFLDSGEEFINLILPHTADLIIKSVVTYWEEKLESSEDKEDDNIILLMTKFFNKKEIYTESLWKSLADSIINLKDIKAIDETISPLKFCLIYIDIKSNDNRIKYYVPIITNLLGVTKRIPLTQVKFKEIKKIIFIALTYTKSLQQSELYEKENKDLEENKNKITKDEIQINMEVDNWVNFSKTKTLNKAIINELANEIENEDNKIMDIYKISDVAGKEKLLNYDKNLLDKLSLNISEFQEYYIEILKKFLNIKLEQKKHTQIAGYEISFFRLISELTLRLQEYSQSDENVIPNWVKYLEALIFNYYEKNDYTENTLSFEATNILLDLNLSFSQKNNVYKAIRENFKSANIDDTIINEDSINDITNKMKVQRNCFELLLGKFYLQSKTQSHIKNTMEILLKLYYFNKGTFSRIIDENTDDKSNENIKLFSNFWKLANENYPEENFFKKETIFKMIDSLESKNPYLRHLSKTWLNQANQLFSKIIDPILEVLGDKTIEYEDDVENQNSEFLKEFKTSTILDALNKLKNIIINSQIMPFLKGEVKDEILSKIKYEKYTKDKMSYLQILISILLHYIRTKAKDNLSDEFKKNVFSINAASTEFLEFLLKNINDHVFLIKNTYIINKNILKSLRKSLEQEDEVMPVQLLDVLKSLYFNYPPNILQNQENKNFFIKLLMDKSLSDTIIFGMAFDHFYIREHFISFTKKLVEIFFNSISIEDKKELKEFYQLCNQFIQPLSKLLTKKVVCDNKLKQETETFSHFDHQNSRIIFKNYCEEYKEYKTYDESEVYSILQGINDIISNCFKNKIQQKNKEMGTDKGIKLFLIPIPIIKKKAIVKMDFQGNWIEHKKKLANDLKEENPFLTFMTTIFDFVDENPNSEIKDMSSDLYRNQIFTLLNSFLTVWINQSDKYEKYDYCLNDNGILPPFNNNYSKEMLPRDKINEMMESINKNPIKNLIINIALNLFTTDSIKFIENIILLWCQGNIAGKSTINDKQYKLAIIELLISMDIPIDVIMFCVGAYLQKFFNKYKKEYKKINKSDKYYPTPRKLSIKEAKIFHFIYSFILLNHNGFKRKREIEITEIWKELSNIMNNTLNESKILYTFCWLYEIFQLASQKFSVNLVDGRELKNGIENIFYTITNKLMDAVFSKKTDSKYINKDEKLVLPFLPHVYSNMIKELYKGDDLYHKNLEGGRMNSNISSTKSKKSVSDNIERKTTTLLYENDSDSKNKKQKLSKSLVNNENTINEEAGEKTVNEFYLNYINVAKFSSEYYSSKEVDNIMIGQKTDVNNTYQKLAFIVLMENFYPIIKEIFKDSVNTAKKYCSEIVNKLLSLIKKSLRKEDFLVEFAHKFLSKLMENSPKMISSCGKDVLMDYIKSPMLFVGTPSELHAWKIIIKNLANYYNDILRDLINDMTDKNIFVKTTEEEKGQILRRVSFVIYSCKTDYFSKDFNLIKTKAKELLSEFSNDNYLEREIFLIMRMLFLKFSHDAVMQMIRDLWPIIFTEIVKNINNYLKLKTSYNKNPENAKNKKYLYNLIDTIIEPFKFIELLSLVNIEEFSLYQWIFIMDTFDINDCDIRINSLVKQLSLDRAKEDKFFKPLAYKIIEEDVLNNPEENMLRIRHKGKSELLIDDKANFIKSLTELFYSIGDMNCYKVDANYQQIKVNIEKDFIDKGDALRLSKKGKSTMF